MRCARWIAGCALVVLSASRAAAEEPLIFKKEESWGPCPANAVCRQTTELFSTGRLVKTGRVNSKAQVGPMAVERVLGAIRRSGILKKACPVTAEVADAFIQYSFTVDGLSQTVKAPGCVAELRAIESALAPPVPLAPGTEETESSVDEADQYDPGAAEEF